MNPELIIEYINTEVLVASKYSLALAYLESGKVRVQICLGDNKRAVSSGISPEQCYCWLTGFLAGMEFQRTR